MKLSVPGQNRLRRCVHNSPRATGRCRIMPPRQTAVDTPPKLNFNCTRASGTGYLELVSDRFCSGKEDRWHNTHQHTHRRSLQGASFSTATTTAAAVLTRFEGQHSSTTCPIPVATKPTASLPPGATRENTEMGSKRKQPIVSAYLRGVRARPPLELGQSCRSRVREKQRQCGPYVAWTFGTESSQQFRRCAV